MHAWNLALDPLQSNETTCHLFGKSLLFLTTQSIAHCSVMKDGVKFMLSTQNQLNVNAKLSHLLSNRCDYIWGYVSFLQYLSCYLWSFVVKINQITNTCLQTRNESSEQSKCVKRERRRVKRERKKWILKRTIARVECASYSDIIWKSSKRTVCVRNIWCRLCAAQRNKK